MNKLGDVSYTVYHGASADGYPVAKSFTTLVEAMTYAIEQNKDSHCRPVKLVKNVVAAVFDKAFEEVTDDSGADAPPGTSG